MYYQKNLTVIKDPPPQYMNAIEKLKRYEKIAKAAPMLATLAVLTLGQAVHAATPSPQICTPFGCIRVCVAIGPIKICIL
jgi:hypothetical protein